MWRYNKSIANKMFSKYKIVRKNDNKFGAQENLSAKLSPK